MRIVKVKPGRRIGAFDCGDEDLNGFLLNDAADYAEKSIAYTFTLEDDNGRAVAYYSLLNDKVSKPEVTHAACRRLKRLFPHEKHFSSYPAIKIGRFAVSKDCGRQGVGSKLMTAIKRTLHDNATDSAFRFLTVDAYINAVPFYEKNGFKMLVSGDDDMHTRLMYYDMMEV